MAVEWFQIRVRGHLGETWSPWFAGLSIKNLPGGDALMVGPVADQAALHGILAKIRDLGLPLVSLKRMRAQPDAQPERE